MVSALSNVQARHIWDRDAWVQRFRSVRNVSRFQSGFASGVAHPSSSQATKSKDQFSQSLGLNQHILNCKTLEALESIVREQCSLFNRVNCATAFRRSVKLFSCHHGFKRRLSPPHTACVVRILSQLTARSRELVDTFDCKDFASIWWSAGTLIQNLTLSQLEDAISEKDLDMFEEKTIHALTQKWVTDNMTAANWAQSLATFLWGKTKMDRLFLASGASLVCH